METTSFRKDDSFSKKCQLLGEYDKYYKTEEFKQILQKLRKRGAVDIVKIERKETSDNYLFQVQSHLDAIIELSCGTTLNVDEKSESYFKYCDKGALDKFAVEIVSNPNKGYKHDGWAYHEGTTIIKMKYLCELRDGMKIPLKSIGKPCVFRAGRALVEEAKKYPYIPNKSTSGLYQSGYSWVDREVLERLWF